MKKVLLLFATGNYTLTAIRTKMFDLGLKAKGGKHLHISTIAHILLSPFYYGHFLYRVNCTKGVTSQ